jgi:hypothetical protein
MIFGQGMAARYLYTLSVLSCTIHTVPLSGRSSCAAGLLMPPACSHAGPPTTLHAGMLQRLGHCLRHHCLLGHCLCAACTAGPDKAAWQYWLVQMGSDGLWALGLTLRTRLRRVCLAWCSWHGSVCLWGAAWRTCSQGATAPLARCWRVSAAHGLIDALQAAVIGALALLGQAPGAVLDSMAGTCCSAWTEGMGGHTIPLKQYLNVAAVRRLCIYHAAWRAQQWTVRCMQSGGEMLKLGLQICLWELAGRRG